MTAYVQKESKEQKGYRHDLGVKDEIAFSSGIKVSYSVPQSERLKKLQRYFSRAKKGSKTGKSSC
ncbi:MAG: hypothetical protein RXR21_06220 [Nitrososphaeria archaeon]